MESSPHPDPSTQAIENPLIHVRSLDMDFHFKPDNLSIDAQAETGAQLATEFPQNEHFTTETPTENLPSVEMQKGETEIASYDALTVNTALLLAGMKKTFSTLKTVGSKAKSGITTGAKAAKLAGARTKKVLARESSIAYDSGLAQIKDIRSKRALASSENAEKKRDKKADKLNELQKKENLNKNTSELYSFIGKLARAGTEADRDAVRQDQISLTGSIPTPKSATERRKVRAIMKRERAAALKQAYRDGVNNAYHSPTAQTRGLANGVRGFANGIADASEKSNINQLAKSGVIDEAERQKRIRHQKVAPASSKNPIQRKAERSAQRARHSADRRNSNIITPSVNQDKREKIIAKITDRHKDISSRLADSARFSQEAQIHKQEADAKKALR